MPRTVMDIFLSSTSKDLAPCRDRVREMIDRMALVSVAMETFGARPTKPLAACREDVERADALIVLVGHRYGWTPSKKDGGDARRSITWWEVKWALDSGKPVFAFLVDPDAEWSAEREQDRLLTATSDAQVLEIGRAVQGLGRFRQFLETETTREVFSNVDNLGGLVATSLHRWILNHALITSGERDTSDASPIARIEPISAKGQKRAAAQPSLTALDYVYEQIHLTTARSLVPDASTVRIGLIAGKADTTHPAFAGAQIQQVNVTGQRGSRSPDEFTTWLAGLLVGADGEYRGVAPGAELVVFGVLDENYDVKPAALVRAIDAARIEGVNVVCLSLGGSGRDAAAEAAVKELVAAGIAAVCPAGNESSAEPIYPAAFAEALAVAATAPSGRLTDFSSFGDWVTVAAPGEKIIMPDSQRGYSSQGGTSFSCAIAAGVVALMIRANPRLSPEEIARILRDTAVPLPPPFAANGGLINAYSAVKAAAELPPPTLGRSKRLPAAAPRRKAKRRSTR